MALGAEMLEVVPGRVSTEVDARLSHDERARARSSPLRCGMQQRRRSAALLRVFPHQLNGCPPHRTNLSPQATVDRALRLVDRYAAHGVEPSRLFIKIAATYAGARACGALQAQGIDTNMTLIFSFAQARAARAACGL